MINIRDMLHEELVILFYSYIFSIDNNMYM